MNTIKDFRRQDTKPKLNVAEWLLAALDILDLGNLTVVVVDAPETTGDTVFYGITEKLEMPNFYRLYLLSSATTATLKDVICHECIHIKQYQEGRLRIKDKYTLVFDGKEYHPPYDKKQPHEKEAWREQGKLKKQVKKYLKQK